MKSWKNWAYTGNGWTSMRKRNRGELEHKIDRRQKKITFSDFERTLPKQASLPQK